MYYKNVVDRKTIRSILNKNIGKVINVTMFINKHDVSNYLCTLHQQGFVQRVDRGSFYCPHYNGRLNYKIKVITIRNNFCLVKGVYYETGHREIYKSKSYK